MKLKDLKFTQGPYITSDNAIIFSRAPEMLELLKAVDKYFYLNEQSLTDYDAAVEVSRMKQKLKKEITDLLNS